MPLPFRLLLRSGPLGSCRLCRKLHAQAEQNPAMRGVQPPGSRGGSGGGGRVAGTPRSIHHGGELLAPSACNLNFIWRLDGNQDLVGLAAAELEISSRVFTFNSITFNF